MSDGLSRTQLALYGAAVLVVLLLGARYLEGRQAEPAPAAASPAAGGPPGGALEVEEARPSPATVHVAGAVRRPGVYRLPPGARVDDAVRLAGGATRRADLGAVNLAAEAEDGRQILVPRRGPAAPGAPASSASAGGGTAPAQPLSLNTATLDQLDTLPGVGPATAQKILDFREEHGGFGSVDELGQVPGIGDKRLADLRERVQP